MSQTIDFQIGEKVYLHYPYHHDGICYYGEVTVPRAGNGSTIVLTQHGARTITTLRLKRLQLNNLTDQFFVYGQPVAVTDISDIRRQLV